MAPLQTCPPEILDIVMEHLTVTVGIQKVVLLRTVSRAFDKAILHAVCIAQVVDINDKATPRMTIRMHPTLRGKIMLQKSRTAFAQSGGIFKSNSEVIPEINVLQCCLEVITKVNQTLDKLLDGKDLERANARHEAVAGSIIFDLAGFMLQGDFETQNLLCGAAIIGNLPMFKSILAGNESATITPTAEFRKTPYFRSPLTLAAAGGHFEMVEYLLEQGARQDAEWKNWNSLDDLKYLGDWNCSPDPTRYVMDIEQENTKEGPLRAAVLGGWMDVVELLLRPEYRLRMDSLDYIRAILAGARIGRLDLMNSIFDILGKDISELGIRNFVMWEAIRGDQTNVVQFVLDNGGDLHGLPKLDTGHVERGALHLAASLGKTRMVLFLLEKGADLNRTPPCPQYGAKPVQGAARSGQKETMDLLLAHGADLEQAFCAAAIGGQSRLVKDLLQRFPAELTTDVLVLHECFRAALHSCNLEAMTVLVEAGAPLNERYTARDGKKWKSAADSAMGLFGPGWVVDHLVSLGGCPKGTGKICEWAYVDCRKVLVFESSWNWVGRY